MGLRGSGCPSDLSLDKPTDFLEGSIYCPWIGSVNDDPIKDKIFNYPLQSRISYSTEGALGLGMQLHSLPKSISFLLISD